MTSEAEQAFEEGRAALLAADRKRAMAGFLMALALKPEEHRYQVAALDSLATATGYTSLPPAVLEALKVCAENPKLDLQPLAMVVRTLLAHHPKRAAWLALTHETDSEELETALPSGLLDDVFTDPLVRAVLEHAVNISFDLEDILTRLRRHALTRHTQGLPSHLLDAHGAFFEAMVAQASRCDYAWAETDEERALLDGLSRSDEDQRMARVYRRDQTDITDFETLTHLGDATSRAVQEQYTAYPYPRWERVPPAERYSLGTFLAAKFPQETFPERFNGPVTGLSAGCGTGRGPAILLSTLKDLALTAMDLSPSSLSYAKRKLAELDLPVARIGLGDILNVDALDQSFDLIETSGVLHHMADPQAGLNALCRVLKPDGVIRIALYSEQARKAVVAARQWILDEGISDTPDGVRQARQLLRQLPDAHPAKPVMDTSEYFVLSGLHDLIFNVQEHRFTPRQLARLIDNAGLRLIGFDIEDRAIKNMYADTYPADGPQINLDNWQAFEEKHPDTFAEMYQFWCRPVGDGTTN